MSHPIEKKRRLAFLGRLLSAELRRRAIRFLEKAEPSFDFKGNPDEDQAGKCLMGLFMLMEMHRRTGNFEEASALSPAVGRAITDIGGIFDEDERDRYQQHLSRQEELISQKNDGRHILQLGRW